MIIFGLAKPHVFLSVSTLRLTAAEGVVTAILALAFLVPLAAGAYDLSIGAMMGLSLVVVNWFGANHQSVPIALVAVGSVILCCLVGLLSGIIVVRVPGQLTDRHPRHEPGPDRRRVEDLQQPPDHRRFLQSLREPRQPQRGRSPHRVGLPARPGGDHLVRPGAHADGSLPLRGRRESGGGPPGRAPGRPAHLRIACRLRPASPASPGSSSP